MKFKSFFDKLSINTYFEIHHIGYIKISKNEACDCIGVFNVTKNPGVIIFSSVNKRKN